MVIRRRFGQHFLTSPAILARIADALDLSAGDRVLEIGPGKGALTEMLLAREASLAVLEIDRDLIAGLRSRFPGLEIHEGDALELDWGGIARGAAYTVTGNIPYNITTPLLEKALTPPLPRRIVFTVQREVADRVTAEPGTKAYGALTVGIAVQATATRLLTVPPGAFHPPPRVHSAVLRLTPLSTPRIEVSEGLPFRRFVAGLFGLRRKQLGRAVRELSGWSPARVGEVLGALGLDPTARAETLDPEAIVGLFRGVVDEEGDGI